MLNTGNSLFWSTGINTKGVTAGANVTKGILRGLMGSISRMDIFAAIGITAALVFKKIIKGAYNMSLEFEHAMKEVQTISYATQKNFEGISEAILELSTQVPDAASKLVKAYYQIVSAGYDGAEALDVLSVSAKLATATITDTFNAADVLTYVMNAYGKAAGTATEIADKLFTVVKLGKVKMQELASSLSMVTGLAAEAGMSFNDLASFYAEAVKKIQPHIVSTGIRGFVTALLRASKEGAESAEAAKKMGIEFNVATLKTKGLAYMLNQMATATKGQKEKLMELFPNVRGLIGLLAAMTNEGINFIETSDKIVNSTGNMTDGFIIMVEDTTNQMAILKNNIAKKMKPIGDFIVKIVHDATKEINKLFPNLKREIERFNVIEKQYASLEKKYISLSSKVNRTTQEQEDLNETIKALAIIVPGAVTAWDEYGGALDVNITKMRSLIDLQRQQARIAEKKWIKGQIKDYDDYVNKLEDARNALENARKRNEEAIKTYGDFYNLQEKTKKQLVDLKKRYKSGEITLVAYNKQVAYYSDLLRRKGIPIQNEYKASYDNLNKTSIESAGNINEYRNAIDYLVTSLSGFITLTQKPKKIQFQLRQIGIDLTLEKIKEIQQVYQQLNAQGPVTIEGITITASRESITYVKWLEQLNEAQKEAYEIGKTKLIQQVGLDLDTASYEQLQTVLKNIDDEEIEIAVKMKIAQVDESIREAIEKGNIEDLALKPIQLIKPLFLYNEDDFQNLFSKLETMKSLGLNVSEELTTAWDGYLKFVEKEYTRDSDNYRIAVEQKKQAEKEFAEWKKEQIIEQTELSRIMYDNMTNFFDGFVTDMIFENKSLTDALTNAWHQFANSVIRELIRIEAQKMALEIMGGFKGIFKFIGSLFGPGVIGANKGISNFIVPPGYDNDTYPMFLQSGELVNVIPKNEVKNITNIENLIRDASPVSEKGVPAVTQNENNITNINNLIKDIPPVPHISNVSNSYSSFDSSGIQSELSQLRKLVASKETTILIDNKVMGKFSQRDLAFVVNEGLKVMKKTNL